MWGGCGLEECCSDGIWDCDRSCEVVVKIVGVDN